DGDPDDRRDQIVRQVSAPMASMPGTASNSIPRSEITQSWLPSSRPADVQTESTLEETGEWQKSADSVPLGCKTLVESELQWEERLAIRDVQNNPCDGQITRTRATVRIHPASPRRRAE